MAWSPLTLALAVTACAPEERGEEYVALRPNGDLLVAAATVERSESVVGDVMLVGGTVEFLGDVGGSYLGAGGQQEVHGRIEGSGRVAGGSVRFGSSVGRNVTLAGGGVQLLDEAVVEHNAYLAGGSVDVDGLIRGDLYVGARDVVLDGTVEGDVRVEAERLSVGPAARIGGNLTYRVGVEPATISGDAEIVGEVEALPPREEVGPSAIVMYVIRVLSFVLCGGALVALFPGAAAATTRALQRRPAPALGVGVLWLILVPVAALVATITIIGMPLALIIGAAYAASIYVAPAVPAMWLGDLLVRPREESIRASRLRSFFAGAPLLGIAILLPWAGFVVRLAAGLLGLGAMALAIRERWT